MNTRQGRIPPLGAAIPAIRFFDQKPIKTAE
jgi:hypothetical protein